MASLTNIRFHTITTVVPDTFNLTLSSVKVVNGILKVEYADGLYSLLGYVSTDDYTIPTPLEPQCPCGENTSNSNVFATLLKGVDGITPDMSDYYDKGVVEEKLAKKQDAIGDLDIIRSNASKGATALQSVPSEYITESELSAKSYATTSQVNTKQDKISDLDTIRSGASMGATALQSVPSEYVKQTQLNELSETVEELNNNIGNLYVVKQNRIDDLDTIRSGASKGATALQEHQPLKTINGQSIVGSGNITIEGGTGDVDLAGYATEEYVNNAVAEVNVKGEDGYVYSNGEKVDMRFTRSLLPVGTSIPAKANLNTIKYLKVGKYYCSLNVDAETITNCPVNVAFAMEVFNPLGTNVDDEDTKAYCYRIRILTEFNTGIQYIQYCNTGATAGSWTYNSWYVTPRTSFTLNSSKNDGSAAKGGKTQGVYIDNTGTFQLMTYTLGKSVPSNAVFTDTNTKVTSVGNHYSPAENESVALNAPDGEVVVGLKRDAAGHVVGVATATMSGGGSNVYESNIEDKELAMPNAVGGIAKDTTISALEGKTYNEMFDDILFPTVNPTFTAPSATIAFKNYSSTQEVGATGPTTSNFTTTYSAGEIKLNGVKQANRGGTQDTSNSFIYVGGNASNKTLPTKVTLGSTTFKYRAAYAEGPQPKNNKGGDYSTPLTAGYVDSSAVTLNGTYPWFASTSSATSTNPVVKQSLVAWNATAGNMSTGQFTVQPSGTLPQVFKLPRQLKTLQLKNALNNQMENVADISKDYAETTETINIGGTNVTYYVYTYTGSTRGSVTLLAKF